MTHDSEIQRCPHDRQNPYSIVSNALIRDKSLSMECRWLLIYLLSNSDGWHITISQVMDHLQGMAGRDKVYKILNEAIEAGYVLREKYLEKNLERCRYFVSETPKFKKCLPRPCFQDAGGQDAENTHALKKYQEEINNKEEGGSAGAREKMPPPFFSDRKVKMKMEEAEKLKKDLGEPRFQEMCEKLNAYADRKSQKFAEYTSHAAVIRQWAKKDEESPESNRESACQKNRSYAIVAASRYNEKSGGKKPVRIDINSDHVAFVYTSSAAAARCILYDEKGFKEQVDKEIMKANTL